MGRPGLKSKVHIAAAKNGSNADPNGNGTECEGLAVNAFHFDLLRRRRFVLVVFAATFGYDLR